MNKKDFFIVVAQGFILGLLIYVLHFVLQNVFSFSIPREDPFKAADALVESIWLKMKLLLAIFPFRFLWSDWYDHRYCKIY